MLYLTSVQSKYLENYMAFFIDFFLNYSSQNSAKLKYSSEVTLAGFSTTTSDTTAIKDQDSKLETSYNPTQVNPIFVFEK